MSLKILEIPDRCDGCEYLRILKSEFNKLWGCRCIAAACFKLNETKRTLESFLKEKS